MKKETFILLLLIVLISAFLIAADHTPPLLKLTIINKSGNEIYIQLQSYDYKEFYYLTIPAGTKTSPFVKTFTISENYYFRKTWYGPGAYRACIGMTNSGELIMDRNTRLAFLPCTQIPMREVAMFGNFNFQDFDWESIDWTEFEFDYGDMNFEDFQNMDFSSMQDMTMSKVITGEPSMEKVIYYDWRQLIKDKIKDENEKGGGMNSMFSAFPPEMMKMLEKLLGIDMSTPTNLQCQWRYRYEYNAQSQY